MANKLVALLDSIGAIFVAGFKDAVKVAVIAEPFIDIAFPAVAPIYNAAANGAAAGIAAGKAAVQPGNTEAQNLVAIAVAVEPVLTQWAAASGLPAPTTATILKYAQALLTAMQTA